MLKVVVILCLASTGFGRNFPLERESIGHPRATGDEYKLSGDVKPISYDIHLKPIFSVQEGEEPYFEGTVSITATVEQETDKIVLHKNNIEIPENSITVEQEGVKLVVTPSYDADSDKHFYTLQLNDGVKLQKEKDVKITFKNYKGTFGANNHGFYLAKYVDDKGDQKVFATTQFEATSAREAFPCFDQPDMKATFKISITRPSTYTSISNTVIKETISNSDDGTETDVYEETPIMSTYLVAFVVSELATEISNDKVHSVHGLPHLIKDGRGKYGVENGRNIMDAMETFVDIKYDTYLKNMDQVAIPDDHFSAGAMENWGMVTYKQRYLLEKEGVTTASERQNILSIIAHEFGHMWFGNIVSPQWWKYLWLNEGFATYFEQYLPSLVDEGMRMMDQYLTLVNQVALESDASEDTRPMTHDAGSPKDISSLFDRIAYQKSGAVIRMMEHILTTDVFKAGLNHYLEARKLDTAESKDLWDGMQKAIDELKVDVPNLDGQTIADIMEKWTTTAGYPLVTLSRNDDGLITLSQERFLLKSISNEDTLWPIPINFATPDKLEFDQTTADIWLNKKEEQTEISVDVNKWVILNKQQTGFYRVNYDENTWKLIIDYLNSTNYDKIHVLTRAQLIDDSFNLARSGRLSYEIPMNLSQYLTREKDYIPLATFFKSVTFINNHVSFSENYKHFKKFVNDMLQTVFKELGVKDDNSHINRLNRNNVINWLCRFEDETCINAMDERLTGETAAEPDLQNSIYCGGMRKTEGAQAKFEKLYKLYTDDKVEYLEKSRVLAGMGCSLDEAVLKTFMNAVIGKDDKFKIDKGDISSAFSAVYTSSELGLTATLDFIIENFNDVKAALSTSQFRSIVNGIAARTSSSAHSEKFTTFMNGLEGDDSNDYKDILNAAVDTINSNSKWAKDNLEVLHEWLVAYGSASFVTVSLSLIFSTLTVLALL